MTLKANATPNTPGRRPGRHVGRPVGRLTGTLLSLALVLGVGGVAPSGPPLAELALGTVTTTAEAAWTRGARFTSDFRLLYTLSKLSATPAPAAAPETVVVPAAPAAAQLEACSLEGAKPAKLPRLKKL